VQVIVLSKVPNFIMITVLMLSSEGLILSQ
jgi:hypothetical protein